MEDKWYYVMPPNINIMKCELGEKAIEYLWGCINDARENKINAKTVKKEINDILESVYEKDYVKISEGSNVGGNLKKHLKALDKKMKEAASNLEFEEAAKIRDEIRKLES